MPNAVKTLHKTLFSTFHRARVYLLLPEMSVALGPCQNKVFIRSPLAISNSDCCAGAVGKVIAC
jgi:hypothetical protein